VQLPDAGALQLLQGIGTLRRPGGIDGPAAGDGDLKALSGPVQDYLRTCFHLYSIRVGQKLRKEGGRSPAGFFPFLLTLNPGLPCR